MSPQQQQHTAAAGVELQHTLAPKRLPAPVRGMAYVKRVRVGVLREVDVDVALPTRTWTCDCVVRGGDV